MAWRGPPRQAASAPSVGCCAARRRWRTGWISDVVPHLAHGAVVKTTLDAFDR